MLGIFYFLFRPQPTPQFEFAQVKRQNIQSTVLASGSLAGKNTANLNFLQGGKLAFMNVKTNDKVESGQIIAGLDTQALSIALQQARNNLRDKQATVDKILDDIHLSQYGNGGFANVGTSSETETQRQLRTTAEAARDNAVDAVRSAERNFQDTSITAPFNGLVTQAGVSPGQFVGLTDTIAQVVDDSQIFFDADVDESDIGKVSPGQEAELTFDTFPNRTFYGTVEEILPQTRVTSTQATVVTARILLNSGITFISGLEGQASIIVQKANNVLTIPVEALSPDNTVVVQTPTGFKVIKVTTGIQSDTDVEITKGLSDGQNVILNPPATLPQSRPGPLNRIFGLFRRGS